MASGDTIGVFTAIGGYELPSSNYPQWKTRNQRAVLAFDTTTQETVYWTGVMPRNYAGGNIVVYVTWAADTATSSNIAWDVTFERITDGALDTDSDGFATAQAISAGTVPATAGITSTTNVTCTAGSTGTDSVAAGDVYRLRVRRDVANDAATGDAHLFAVELKEA